MKLVRSFYALVLISVRSSIDHRAARGIVNENSNDIIGNRTCDVPACSVVHQPTVPIAPIDKLDTMNIMLCQMIRLHIEEK
jgi:hypothetical protein